MIGKTLTCIGNSKGIFAPPLPEHNPKKHLGLPALLAGGHLWRAAMAAPPAGNGQLPQRLAARRSTARRGLGMPLGRGEAEDAGVSHCEGLGAAGPAKLGMVGKTLELSLTIPQSSVLLSPLSSNVRMTSARLSRIYGCSACTLAM